MPFIVTGTGPNHPLPITQITRQPSCAIERHDFFRSLVGPEGTVTVEKAGVPFSVEELRRLAMDGQ